MYYKPGVGFAYRGRIIMTFLCPARIEHPKAALPSGDGHRMCGKCLQIAKDHHIELLGTR